MIIAISISPPVSKHARWGIQTSKTGYLATPWLIDDFTILRSLKDDSESQMYVWKLASHLADFLDSILRGSMGFLSLDSEIIIEISLSPPASKHARWCIQDLKIQRSTWSCLWSSQHQCSIYSPTRHKTQLTLARPPRGNRHHSAQPRSPKSRTPSSCKLFRASRPQQRRCTATTEIGLLKSDSPGQQTHAVSPPLKRGLKWWPNRNDRNENRGVNRNKSPRLISAARIHVYSQTGSCWINLNSRYFKRCALFAPLPVALNAGGVRWRRTSSC